MLSQKMLEPRSVIVAPPVKAAVDKKAEALSEEIARKSLFKPRKRTRKRRGRRITPRERLRR